ncbi:unnamed protein product [Acanthoscelides obtectus]|uniref:Uncharacterized protein n=1 Tax=Acanthoscelides obtectus TaxID=200917 RepID=A0A9P0NVG6_ACAOB|nr:unnamed protein product [Acanthoscelides obtectus]CAK1661755.1 hypothetical protein AOBTE_LOCUS22777 [Acanthoscelides obtectus]
MGEDGFKTDDVRIPMVEKVSLFGKGSPYLHPSWLHGSLSFMLKYLSRSIDGSNFNLLGSTCFFASSAAALWSDKPDCCWDVNKSPRRKFRD